jgi:hypothetical protein
MGYVASHVALLLSQRLAERCRLRERQDLNFQEPLTLLRINEVSTITRLGRVS